MLGLITDDVQALRDRFQLPVQRRARRSFDGNSNPHLPGNFLSNSVVYTGTHHDNPTTRGWFDELPGLAEKIVVWGYLRRAPGDNGEIAAALMIGMVLGPPPSQ